MNELEESGMRCALDKAVLYDGKPILGICVGMEILADSREKGKATGLNWVDGVVNAGLAGAAHCQARTPVFHRY